MPFTLEELMKIIHGPETSYHLKEWVLDIDEMDPVDALHDAEMLLSVCKARLYQVQQNNEGGK